MLAAKAPRLPAVFGAEGAATPVVFRGVGLSVSPESETVRGPGRPAFGEERRGDGRAAATLKAPPLRLGPQQPEPPCPAAARR